MGGGGGGAEDWVEVPLWLGGGGGERNRRAKTRVMSRLRVV